MGAILPPAYPSNDEYFLAFVEDYTRYAFVHTFRYKTAIHLGFEKFYDNIKRTVPYDVKTSFICMDNSTEYKTKKVVQFLSKNSILEDLAPPNTSPLNGTAERFNRTIQNCARAMLSDSGLPKRFWAYAVKYATLIHNYLPKSACNFQILHAMLYNELPKLRFLRRFGCVAHVTLPKKVGKFSDRAICKFFDGLTSNSALLLNVATGSIKAASNVFFTESQVYGHFYGPFENTRFRDPIKLVRTKIRSRSR